MSQTNTNIERVQRLARDKRQSLNGRQRMKVSEHDDHHSTHTDRTISHNGTGVLSGVPYTVRKIAIEKIGIVYHMFYLK